MPTETFLKLAEDKRERFVEEALKEFSEYNFETASINRIIKKVGIARGSVYQYFTDKLDLWLYLKEYAEGQKIKYIQSIHRSSYSSFWEYYKDLYMQGISFDLEQSLCSVFLYRVGFKESSKEVALYLNGWKSKAKEMFTFLVEEEKKTSGFNHTIATDTAVHFLITMSMSIAELLQSKYKLDFEENIRNGKPLFGANKSELETAVSELILLMEKALK